jgi:hypothetical protein
MSTVFSLPEAVPTLTNKAWLLKPETATLPALMATSWNVTAPETLERVVAFAMTLEPSEVVEIEMLADDTEPDGLQTVILRITT